jgi:glycosyltransferase involved in cell wall biosynthesis
MKVALIAPPFIPVPPLRYGGTELFVAHLAEGLAEAGHHPIVYAVRSSTVACEVRGWFDSPDWPPASEGRARIRNQVHTVRAIHDAISESVDIIHIQDAIGVPLAVFSPMPVVYTVHHTYDELLSHLYAQFNDIHYVTISHFQRAQENFSFGRTIHHGVRLESYLYREQKDRYLSFLGRIAPMKGVHIAIDVARQSGIPLKIAGEIQPVFLDYWENQVKPHVDGEFIQYVGEADHGEKIELLSRSMAVLFPIQWNEPFGLVMIEAMACGTPVLAFGEGSVPEVVVNGVNGWICADVAEMAAKALNPDVWPGSCRRDVEQRFSLKRMTADYEALYVELLAQMPTQCPGAQ